MNNENRLITYNLDSFSKSKYWEKLTPELRHNLKVAAQVLPFRVNNYVLNNLINFDDLENDPMFTLCFLKKDMLNERDFQQIEKSLLASDAQTLKQSVMRIRNSMNPHPAAQSTLNLAYLNGQVIPGVQHKYKETVLVFPAAGQTCFSYCSFCFRWAQFVETDSIKFQTDRQLNYLDYLKSKTDVTDVLFTGGDPMVMSAKHLRKYLEPLLDTSLRHIQNIRIGTKALSYWPKRFTTDPDADAIIELMERLVSSGKSVTFMAHINHPKELGTPEVETAIKRILSTGTMIKAQSPLLKRINDDAKIWQILWQKQVNLGIVPYYMFVERDTGPKDYFQVPLLRAYDIFKDAYQRVSGLARTVRGPSMSCAPGKICIEGPIIFNGTRVLGLKFLQSRNADWCNQIFLAQWDEEATWIDQLKPAFGQSRFFFENPKLECKYASN